LHSILHLQRTIGNLSAQRLLHSNTEDLEASPPSILSTTFAHDFSQIRAHPKGHSNIQYKLKVGPPEDKYEQEADRVADQLMSMPDRQFNVPTESPTQRQPVEEENLLQAKPVPGQAQHVSPSLAVRINRLRGGGQPLTSSMRAFFEPRFRHDFSAVRIHTASHANETAGALNARAFTIGRDIVFGASQYAPATSEGRRLLAHELTHVVHQSASTDLVQRFTTQDCDPPDVTRINASHNRAIAMLNKAIRRLTASPVTANTQRHFSNHFGGYGSWRRDIVVGHFRRDLSLMTASNMTYECEAQCDPGEPAYTYWIFGDIHICLPWLRSETLNERGESFIHELHHWDASRGHLDLGYHRNNTDNKTTWIVAVNNADAYSELAQDLFEQP
jgi:hypothetical protein